MTTQRQFFFALLDILIGKPATWPKKVSINSDSKLFQCHSCQHSQLPLSLQNFGLLHIRSQLFITQFVVSGTQEYGSMLFSFTMRLIISFGYQSLSGKMLLDKLYCRALKL
jgi:hypothetical protein